MMIRNNSWKIKYSIRETKEKDIKSVLRDFFSAYHINVNLYEQDIIKAWRDVTGELIYKLTTKIYVQNNCLYVSVNSPALKHELIMLRSSLIEKIKAKIPKEAELKNIYIK